MNATRHLPILTNDMALAGLRVAVGALFLILASYKVTDSNFVFGTGPTSFLWWQDQFLTRGGTYPFAIGLITDVSKPIGWPIAALVAFGELAIGISLVSGVLVRVASVCGIVYMLSLVLITNYPGANAPFWSYFGRSVAHVAPAMCFAAFALGDSVKVWSISAYRRSLKDSQRHSHAVDERAI